MTTAGTSPLTHDDGELRAALSEANLPTLLLVLRALSGDRAWSQDPFRPSRTVALDDNDAGGFDDATQQAIRESAFTLLTTWRDEGGEVPQPPDDRDIPEMLSVSLGDQIPEEYGPSLAEQGGFRDWPHADWSGQRPDSADDQHVVIIGGGLAGVAAAIALQRRRIPYTLLERNAELGGVWVDNAYPGAGVDTPSHLYSYSFAPHGGWSRYYAKQPEIADYVRRTAAEHGIGAHVRLGARVDSATWDATSQCWTVSGEMRSPESGEESARAEPFTLTATSVITCVGILNSPRIPRLPGMADFTGQLLHSTSWNAHVDVTGRRVAVIGTGATSMQLVPAVAGQARHVSVYQRSPQWVVPNPNYARHVSPATRLLMEQVPFYAAFYRLRLIWMIQDKLLAALYRDPTWEHPERSVNRKNDRQREFLTQYLEQQIQGHEELRDKVVPAYPPYAKRMLMDNGWISTILRDDVSLIDSEVIGFDETGVLTRDGDRQDADVVVLATGFESARMLSSVDFRGVGGVSLRDRWRDDDPFAHLGVSVPDFPNLFIVGGPNTNIGHGGSAIYPAECALTYVLKLIIAMVENDIGSVDVRPEVCRDYNARVDAEHERLIWTHPGTNNWFRNRHGRVTATTPWRGVDLWAMTREPDLADFVTVASQRRATATPTA